MTGAGPELLTEPEEQATDPKAGPTTGPTTGSGPEPAAPQHRRPSLVRSRLIRWLVLAVLVIAAVLLAAGAVSGAVGAQTAGDPSSTTKDGSGAVAQLLRDQGVRLIRTEAVRDASRDAVGPATLVVVHPERLSAGETTQLLSARSARIVLVRPNTVALARFGVAAGAVAAVAQSAVLSPACVDPAALRAGTILTPADSLGYRTDASGSTAASDLGCYPDGSGNAVYRRIASRTSTIDLVGTGFPNEDLAREGNASFALGVLGSQPTVVWLMAREVAPSTSRPALLPRWWDLVAVQALVGLIAVALWRGRRLGPIISERLPVLVPASETVEGHGRLYYRLAARDRAAAALRAGVCRRLGPRYGQRTDPLALARAVSDRTGRDPVQVQTWLAGPVPTDDQQLDQLAHDLDQLEQEAQQL